MDATTFFLTYPQADISNDDLHAHLGTIQPVVWARVARERHADGNWHSHAIVRFGARVRTRSNMGMFDVHGHHPNIQVPRKIGAVLKYLSKDGDFTDYGEVPEGKLNKFDECIGLAKSGNRAAFDLCALENGLSFQWAQYLWSSHSAATNDVLESGGGTECLQLQGLQLHDSKSMVVIGPSGCGKTTWALRVAPKPALWVNHMDDLKKLNNGHKSIIFDDMDFKHLPRTAQIYIADKTQQRSIHCRYGNAIIPANTIKIFTANEDPFIDDPAVNRRLHKFKIISWTV